MNNIRKDKTLYNDKERMFINNNQYLNLDMNQNVMINIGSEKETIGIVSHIVDDSRGSGLQEYVITDNYVPIDASYEERAGVKDVTILYRGSTSIADIGKVYGNRWEATEKDADTFVDGMIDWTINNAQILYKSVIPRLVTKDKTYPWLQNKEIGTRQMQATTKELNKVEQAYPNAKIWIYGHSQSNSNMQKAVVNMLNPERLAGA